MLRHSKQDMFFFLELLLLLLEFLIQDHFQILKLIMQEILELKVFKVIKDQPVFKVHLELKVIKVQQDSKV